MSLTITVSDPLARRLRSRAAAENVPVEELALRILLEGVQSLATRPTPSSKEALRSLAGAWKDDPFRDELRQRINAERERPAAEDSE